MSGNNKKNGRDPDVASDQQKFQSLNISSNTKQMFGDPSALMSSEVSYSQFSPTSNPFLKPPLLSTSSSTASSIPSSTSSSSSPPLSPRPSSPSKRTSKRIAQIKTTTKQSPSSTSPPPSRQPSPLGCLDDDRAATILTALNQTPNQILTGVETENLALHVLRARLNVWGQQGSLYTTPSTLPNNDPSRGVLDVVMLRDGFTVPTPDELWRWKKELDKIALKKTTSKKRRKREFSFSHPSIEGSGGLMENKMEDMQGKRKKRRVGGESDEEEENENDVWEEWPRNRGKSSSKGNNSRKRSTSSNSSTSEIPFIDSLTRAKRDVVISRMRSNSMAASSLFPNNRPRRYSEDGNLIRTNSIGEQISSPETDPEPASLSENNKVQSALMLAPLDPTSAFHTGANVVVRKSGKVGSIIEEKAGGWRVVLFKDGSQGRFRPSELKKIRSGKGSHPYSHLIPGDGNSKQHPSSLKQSSRSNSTNMKAQKKKMGSVKSHLQHLQTNPYSRPRSKSFGSPSHLQNQQRYQSSLSSSKNQHLPPSARNKIPLSTPYISSTMHSTLQSSGIPTIGRGNQDLYGARVVIKKSGVFGTIIGEKAGGWRIVQFDQPQPISSVTTKKKSQKLTTFMIEESKEAEEATTDTGTFRPSDMDLLGKYDKAMRGELDLQDQGTIQSQSSSLASTSSGLTIPTSSSTTTPGADGLDLVGMVVIARELDKKGVIVGEKAGGLKIVQFTDQSIDTFRPSDLDVILHQPTSPPQLKHPQSRIRQQKKQQQSQKQQQKQRSKQSSSINMNPSSSSSSSSAGLVSNTKKKKKRKGMMSTQQQSSKSVSYPPPSPSKAVRLHSPKFQSPNKLSSQTGSRGYVGGSSSYGSGLAGIHDLLGKRVLISRSGEIGVVVEEKAGGWKVILMEESQDGQERKLTLRPGELELASSANRSRKSKTTSKSSKSSSSRRQQPKNNRKNKEDQAVVDDEDYPEDPNLIFLIQPVQTKDELQKMVEEGYGEEEEEEENQQQQVLEEEEEEEVDYATLFDGVEGDVDIPAAIKKKHRISSISEDLSNPLFIVGSRVRIKRSGKVGIVVEEKFGGWRKVKLEQDGSVVKTRPSDLYLI